MSALDWIMATIGIPPKAAVQLPQSVTANSSSWDDWFAKVPGLPSVNERSILSISAAYACANLIAGAISAIPLALFQELPNGERDEIHGDDLWWLLNEQFLPRWSASAAWEFLVMSKLFHGDAFARIIRRGPKIIGLEPIHPRNVVVFATLDRTRLVYSVTWEGGQTETIDQDDMLHVAGFGFNGFRSISVLQHVLGTSGAIALATQDFAARFFTNSARPDFVLITDQVVTQTIADQVGERWREKFEGHSNSHKPALLGSGFDIKALTLTAEDAQLLATRQFQVEEIARAFGVPPHMIGHVEKTTSWGAGVESMGKGFVRFTLGQHLNAFKTEINRKFFRSAGKFVGFDTFELESADMKSLFESFRVAVGRAGEPGFMSTDEVRQKLNLRRTPGGGALSSGLTTGTTDAQQAA